MAFAGQIAQQIGDRDGHIRCLRATFADMNDAAANSLLKSLGDQRARYRSLGSSDQPRVVRTVFESRAPPRAPRSKMPQVSCLPVTVKTLQAAVANGKKEVASQCREAFQVMLDSHAAASVYVVRCVSVNLTVLRCSPHSRYSIHLLSFGL